MVSHELYTVNLFIFVATIFCVLAMILNFIIHFQESVHWLRVPKFHGDLFS